jgi:uncharacterized protein YkwD
VAWSATAVLVASGLVASGPAGAAAVNPNSGLTDSSTWLQTANAWRAASDLPAVTEDATLTAGEVAHSTYVVKTGQLVHAEDPMNPNYSADGDAAGQNGNVAASSNATKTDRQFVEQWITAPFHAAGLLDPQLVTSAFGAFRDAAATPFKAAATMDVLRGRTGPVATSATLFPGNDSILPVAEQAYQGGESPDPLSPCAGYDPGTGTINTGVPIFALLPHAPTAATLTATLTPDGGSPVTSCAYDETSYTNPVPGDQTTGQQVMASRHQVIVVPHDPLTQGVHYTVSISVTYTGDLTPTVTSWGFTAAALPRVSIGNASVVEGNRRARQMRFTVSLSAPTTDPVSVSYATAAGNATDGTDFVAKSGTVNFPAGATAAVVKINIKGDRIPEPQEMFKVKLSNPVNALQGRAVGTGSIISDDSPSVSTPELSIGSASVVEGNSGPRSLRFAVTLSSPAAVPVSVDWDTHDGTADSTAGLDFVEGHGNLTIPAGTVSGVVLVRVSADAINEPNELFTIKLTDAAGAPIRRAVGTGTIIDDD